MNRVVFMKFIATSVASSLKLLSDNQNTKYSNNWLESKSDDELETEREKVRLDHCSGDEKAWNILGRFDNEMRKRENIGHENEEYKYPKHREHGWYLSNDDD
ncbi:hypothetical protein [Clostridium sp.]|uniref:hypothetical protein n=1 Tax=Clostridium sp. TaxID=1506 RepID=UPI00262A2274|nr:hypothetical protein [Clostridium sp.]